MEGPKVLSEHDAQRIEGLTIGATVQDAADSLHRAVGEASGILNRICIACRNVIALLRGGETTTVEKEAVKQWHGTHGAELRQNLEAMARAPILAHFSTAENTLMGLTGMFRMIDEALPPGGGDYANFFRDHVIATIREIADRANSADRAGSEAEVGFNDSQWSAFIVNAEIILRGIPPTETPCPNADTIDQVQRLRFTYPNANIPVPDLLAASACTGGAGMLAELEQILEKKVEALPEFSGRDSLESLQTAQHRAKAPEAFQTPGVIAQLARLPLNVEAGSDTSHTVHYNGDLARDVRTNILRFVGTHFGNVGNPTAFINACYENFSTMVHDYSMERQQSNHMYWKVNNGWDFNELAGLLDQHPNAGIAEDVAMRCLVLPGDRTICRENLDAVKALVEMEIPGDKISSDLIAKMAGKPAVFLDLDNLRVLKDAVGRCDTADEKVAVVKAYVDNPDDFGIFKGRIGCRIGDDAKKALAIFFASNPRIALNFVRLWPS
jgi:hypothetical protein